MIPKILHFMWLDKHDDEGKFPERYDKYTEMFKIHNSDFQFIFWNMKTAKDLFRKHPQIQKYEHFWLNLKKHISKCDFARFLILYLFGGIYIDLDFRCFRNLSPLLDRDLLLVWEPEEHFYGGKPRLFNGFIGSVPSHVFWIDWVEFIVKSFEITNDVMETTGPVNFGRFMLRRLDKTSAGVDFVDTCDILPLIDFPGSRTSGGGKLTKKGTERNKGIQYVDENEYYKTYGNYVDTLWREGTNWAADGSWLPIFCVVIVIILFVVLFIVFLSRRLS
jgi:hypothetical protein